VIGTVKEFSTRRHHYIDDVASELARVLVLDELHEGLFESGLADLAEDVIG
jgi:hypothetical protein